MAKSDLPEDFLPTFSKDYEVGGNHFTIDVQYNGIHTKTYRDPFHQWFFAVFVNGNLIDAGDYKWSKGERTLNDENAANHLATFWAHSKLVEEAQDLEPDYTRQLDELVFKCAAWMHKYFMQSEEFQDFEVLRKFMDGNGWEITLSPNYLHGRIVEFMQQTGEDYVKINSYIEDNELSVKL